MNHQIQPAPPRLPAPTRVGQATAVEQSRAAAEVQAAVVVAQQCPRNIDAALSEMRRSCREMGLAERAFYSYPRSGQTVTGPSIHLARELARCWGNIQYGVNELSRDDDHGQSEVLAFAWDVQTNSRSSQVFIVPHKRDTKSGPKALVDLRDVYENNANNGARRLRESIFSVLPPWFVEEAQELCTRTLKKGNGKPLEERVADAIGRFSGLGITVDQLQRKVGRPSREWSEADVVRLGVIFKSLQRGEVTRDEEFPPERVTAAEITGPTKAPSAEPSADVADAPPWPEPAPIPNS